MHMAFSGMDMGGGILIRVMEGVGGMIHRETGQVRRKHAVGNVCTVCTWEQ